MVEECVGYALGLDKLLYTQAESSLCFRPFSPRQEIGMDLVWKKYQVFSKASEKFLEQIHQVIAETNIVK